MAYKAISTSVLRGSIERIKQADTLFREHFRDFDFEKVVGTALRELGYAYSIDASSGDFAINAAPGAYIRGKWHGMMYSISIELNFGGLQAQSSSPDNLSLKSSKFFEQYPILISPFGLEASKFYLDKLIENIKTEYTQLEGIAKVGKGAKLIKELIKPTLRRNSLSQTTIEQCEDDSTRFWLSKQIFKNTFIRTRISFDNYENGCAILAKASNCFPICLRDCNGLFYQLDHPYIYKGLTYTGINSAVLTEEKKMIYSTPMPMDGRREEDSVSEISQVLDKLGFLYFKDDTVYNIYITDKLLLKRNGEAFWFKLDCEGWIGKALIVKDHEFIRILELFAWGAPWERLPYIKGNDGYEFLIHLLQKSLPESIEFYYCDKYFTFIDNNEYYTLHVKAKGWLETIYKLIIMFNSQMTSAMQDWIQVITEKYPEVELVFDYWY